MMLSNSSFTPPETPNPHTSPATPPPGAGGWGAPTDAPYGAPQATPPGMEVPGGNFGVPPAGPQGGFGAPPAGPQGGFGAPPAGPQGDFGAPQGDLSQGNFHALQGGMVVTEKGIPDYIPGTKSNFGLNQNLMAGISYLVPIAALLAIFGEPKEHRFIRFHAFQVIFTGIIVFINTIVMIIPIIIANVDSKLQEAIFAVPVLALPLIPISIFNLIALIKAFQGKVWKTPLIGGFAEKMAK